MQVMLRESLRVGIETVEQYRLYTPQPFEKGAQVRAVLETALSDAAVEARAQVLSSIAGGLPREAAVHEYTTDARFEAWADALESQLSAL